MVSINEFFRSHPLEAPFRADKQAACVAAFPKWIANEGFDDWYLSLYPLASQQPLAYHSGRAIDESLSLLQRDPPLAWEAIAAESVSINHAISCLMRPGPSWSREDSLSLNLPEEASDFDGVWHPEYQRYVEHVLNHLIRVQLYFLGKTQQRDFMSTALPNQAECLRKNGLASIVGGYDSTVRNAIAHGTTEYGITSIQYVDRNNSTTLDSLEFGELFDTLVDSCHGILAAILIFAASNRADPAALPSSRLPFGMRYLLTVGLATHPALSISTMLETHSAGTGAQLNIVCKTSNPARGSHQFDGLFLAWLSCGLYPKYDRYLISIDSGRPSHSVLAIHGHALSDAIREDQPLEKCGPRLVEGALLWYDAPRWRSHVATLTTLWSARRPRLVREIRILFEEAKLIPAICDYRVLAVEINSTSSVRKIIAYVALMQSGPVTDSKLESTVNHALRALRRTRVRRSDMNGPKGLAGSPGYITLRLYSRPARLRSLKAATWASPTLILIAEWARSSKAGPPFYTREADLVKGQLRIKFNHALVQTRRPSS